jgi:hypothetical protein
MDSLKSESYLFISYAIEDTIFAEWIEKKLMSYGYLVWRDKSSMLGGERWTEEIELALDNLSFRVIGILSKSSLHKENPSKERTKAIQIGKKKGISDFLITLNVDGVRDLDWLTVDINYIDFTNSWSSGLSQLLTKLEKINMPKCYEQALGSLNKLMVEHNKPDDVTEIVHMNIIQLTQKPKTLYRIVLSQTNPLADLDRQIAFVRQGNDVIWSFELPVIEESQGLEFEAILWEKTPYYGKINLINRVKELVFICIKNKLIERGLSFNEDHRAFIFHNESNRIRSIYYKGAKGRNISIKTIGERTISNNVFVYKLGFNCNVRFNSEKDIFVIITPTYLFYEQSGAPVSPKKVIARRKKLCQSMFNHQWLIRLYAIVQWMTDNDCLTLLSLESNALVLGNKLQEYVIHKGINGDYRDLDYEISSTTADSTSGEI